MGISTISMAIFNSYVSLPEGKPPFSYGFPMVFPLKPPFSYEFSARKKDHIRIVSSTARASEEVLGDLLDEAEALPLVASGAAGETTTTLLVCRWGVQKGGVGKCPILGILDITL